MLAASLLVLALAWPASASGMLYSFRLVKPNTAVIPPGGASDEHHQPGDSIRVTGSGTFDLATGAVTGSGSFVHYDADGTVHLKGTWVATGLVGFTSFGGPTPGHQGGILQLTTLHYDQDGNPCDCMGSGGTTMILTSTVNASVGTVGGTAVGPFTQPTGGSVGLSVIG